MTEVANNSNSVELLTFKLSDQEYSLDIMCVREIRGWTQATPLPHSPAYMKGVINLRGKIIPVVQLRVRFGLEEIEDTESTCIIVVEVENAENEDKHQVGVIVDSVSEVLDIPPGGIEPAPRFASEVECSYIHGMGKVPGHEGEPDEVVVLLDLDNILVTSLLKASGQNDSDTTPQDAAQAA